MKYTVTQAADLVGVNPRRVRKDIAAGRLKARRVARDSRGTYEIDEAALRVTYADVFEAREARASAQPEPQAAPAEPVAEAQAAAPAPVAAMAPAPAAPAAAPSATANPAVAAEVEARLLREMLARECAHSEWLHEQLAHALRMLDARNAPAGRQVLVLGEDSREDAPAPPPMPAAVQPKAPAPGPDMAEKAPEAAPEPAAEQAAQPAPAGLDAMRAALRKPGAATPASAPQPAAPEEAEAPETGDAPLADRFAAYQRRLDQAVANLRRSRMS